MLAGKLTGQILLGKNQRNQVEYLIHVMTWDPSAYLIHTSA